MPNNRPIGFIDSGFGGLTVVKQSLKQLPNETVIFLGDSLRCPYGPRQTQEVKQFTFEMVHYLKKYDIKMLVVACNTATAAALTDLKQLLDIPVIGVISPSARAAIQVSHNNRIGVIATQGTIRSHVYETQLTSKKTNVHVFTKACPSFVEMVENHIPKSLTTIQEELSFFKNTDIDTLILGCTHFPILKNEIAQTMGDEVTLIDTGAETINDVIALLDDFDMAATPTTQPKKHQFLTTGEAKKFQKVAREWLEMPDLTVKTIELESE